MAPCNMRCTTCGEYIYKVSMPTSFKYLIYIKLSQGRKFNARKEDVDDMDYLGLRIYRWKSPAQDFLSLKACLKKLGQVLHQVHSLRVRDLLQN